MDRRQSHNSLPFTAVYHRCLNTFQIIKSVDSGSLHRLGLLCIFSYFCGREELQYTGHVLFHYTVVFVVRCTLLQDFETLEYSKTAERNETDFITLFIPFSIEILCSSKLLTCVVVFYIRFYYFHSYIQHSYFYTQPLYCIIQTIGCKINKLECIVCLKRRLDGPVLHVLSLCCVHKLVRIASSFILSFQMLPPAVNLN